jgi:hypothetical protein
MPAKRRQKVPPNGAKTTKNALKMKKTEMSPPATKEVVKFTNTAWKSQLRLTVYDKKWCAQGV